MPVVLCPTCQGLAVVTSPCRCRSGGGEFLVESRQSVRESQSDPPAWPDCEVCAGTGTVVGDCYDCGKRGRIRAQVVLTVANRDTGQVASTNVVPGAVQPGPAPAGRWLLPLGSVVAELAARTGVAPATLHTPDDPDRLVDLDLLATYLPAEWAPDLPSDRRRSIEARLLAGSWRTPWRVFLGHSTAPPPPDHARLLGRLCALADRLCLDLVVEARSGPGARLTWSIRFELPGAPVPTAPYRYAHDLLTAIARTTAQDAAYDLDRYSLRAPAHYLLPADRPDQRTIDLRTIDRRTIDLRTTGRRTNDPLDVDRQFDNDQLDVDRLERRIIRDCGGTAGGQAIWRSGRWWHTTLRSDTATERLTELETGQVLRQLVPGYRRGWEPPPPPYLGEPIPRSTCQRCGGRGVGGHNLPCDGCAGVGGIHHGVVLTVTDLRARAVHRNWRHDEHADGPYAPAVGYGGGPVRLPDRYRIDRLAEVLRVRPEESIDLTDLTGEFPLDNRLRYGISGPSGAPPSDPVGHYLRWAARGRPGGRLLVRVHDWPGPSLADLARLVFGLGLGVRITALEHRRADTGDPAAGPESTPNVRWSVEVVRPTAGPDPQAERRRPYRISVPDAVAACLRHLGPELDGAAVPADPDLPMSIPQQPRPVPAPGDLAGPVRRIAAAHPGRVVTARWTADGCRTWVHD